MQKTNNLRVDGFTPIAAPAQIMKEVPISDSASETVARARQDIQDRLDGKTERTIIIVGPCSIHDYEQALDYATRLNELREKVDDKLQIIMRTYFEKPRTNIGWKGFIYDPYLDTSYSLDEGVKLARKLLVQINSMGLSTATEVLGPITIQYYSDLICWAAIGARTAESQTHRELSSGLSMPVGFKNGTNGSLDIAINAIKAASIPHHFLGMDDEGKVAIVRTKGNLYGHTVLRGGTNGPNYSAAAVDTAEQIHHDAGIAARLVIDCSHANSSKDHRNQPTVWRSTWEQIRAGNRSICGIMMESNLCEGKQDIGGGFGELLYGVSVTDACIDFEETETLVMEAYAALD